jgi:hypothetical protein
LGQQYAGYLRNHRLGLPSMLYDLYEQYEMKTVAGERKSLTISLCGCEALTDGSPGPHPTNIQAYRLALRGRRSAEFQEASITAPDVEDSTAGRHLHPGDEMIWRRCWHRSGYGILVKDRGFFSHA